MSGKKQYSLAVADLFHETGSWLDTSKNMSAAEAAAVLLNSLTEYVGTETRARAILADIPEAADIVKLLPKRKQRRPKDPVQRRKDAALLDIYQWEKEKGKLVKEIVYSGTAKRLNEASTAGTVDAIASIGGALISGTGQLASAGQTVSKGITYVESQLGLNSPATADITLGGSATDISINTGAALDTSGIALGTSEAAAEAGEEDAIAGGSIFEDVGNALSELLSF